MASSARIDELRKKFDENPRRYFAPLANEYRKAGDLEQAIFICQEYLPQQPGHMSGHIVYGQALFELNRLDEARQVFETALSLDPENLIALRHLGDIARQTGDSRGARGWYQRVLEADPRNEEIAQIMMTLLATPDYAQPAVASSLTPVAIPTIPAETAEIPDQASIPTDPIGFRPADLGVEVEKSEDNTGLSVGPELSALPERQESPVPAPVEAPTSAEAPRSREQIPDAELLDLDDFSIGGISLRELGLTPSIQAQAVPEQPVAEASSHETESHEEDVAFTESPAAFVVESTPAFAAPIREETPTATDAVSAAEEAELAIEKDHLPFEADPYAIASAAVLPEVELSPDITLELPDDGTTPTLADSDNLAVLGLETCEHGVAAPAQETTALEFDSFFATPAQSEAPTPIEASEPLVVSSAEIELPQESESEPAIELPPTVTETPATFEAALPSFEIAEEPADSPSTFEERTPLPALEPAVTPELEPVAEAVSTEPEPVAAAWESVAEPESVPDVEPAIDVLDIDSLAGIEMPAVSETLPEIDALPEPAVIEAAAQPEPPIVEAEVQPEPEPEPVLEWTAPVEDPFVIEAAPSGEAFVTETMAKLYLEQGHLEAALGIYQKLVEQRPFDEGLLARLQQVEEQVYGPVAEPEAEPVLEEEPMAAAGGPTIREFLGDILMSLPTSLRADLAPPADDVIESDEAQALDDVLIVAALGDPSTLPTEDASLDEVFTDEIPYESAAGEVESDFDDASVSVDELPPIESEFGDWAEPTPASSERVPTPAVGVETGFNRGTPAVPDETVSGSIDALFSGAGASSGDTAAADNLAQAFAPESPDTKPLQGMPAHKASNELLLDHVFKTVQAPRAESESEGFSFDQFFADDVGDTASKTGADSTTGAGQTDDIAQFNNWLNGLKKS